MHNHYFYLYKRVCSMKGVGLIFWLSEKAKEFQVLLEEDYELPTYAVFIVIAVATIVVGLSLGGVSCPIVMHSAGNMRHVKIVQFHWCVIVYLVKLFFFLVALLRVACAIVRW